MSCFGIFYVTRISKIMLYLKFYCLFYEMFKEATQDYKSFYILLFFPNLCLQKEYVKIEIRCVLHIQMWWKNLRLSLWIINYRYTLTTYMYNYNHVWTDLKVLLTYIHLIYSSISLNNILQNYTALY